MNCHICGHLLEPLRTDMPFKVSQQTLVVLKGLPVLQCSNCGQYLIEDAVMARVETLLAQADPSAELEVMRYAARPGIARRDAAMHKKPLIDRHGEVRELTREDIRQFRPAGEALSSQLLAALPKRKRGQRAPQTAQTKLHYGVRKMSDKRMYIERRPEGDYAVRKPNSDRASAIEPTQKAAIEKAREMNPGVAPHVERVRHTSTGSPDKWRKA